MEKIKYPCCENPACDRLEKYIFCDNCGHFCHNCSENGYKPKILLDVNINKEVVNFLKEKDIRAGHVSDELVDEAEDELIKKHLIENDYDFFITKDQNFPFDRTLLIRGEKNLKDKILKKLQGERR